MLGKFILDMISKRYQYDIVILNEPHRSLNALQTREGIWQKSNIPSALIRQHGMRYSSGQRTRCAVQTGRLNGSYATLSSAPGAYPRSGKLKVSKPDTLPEEAMFYGGAICIGFVIEMLVIFITSL